MVLNSHVNKQCYNNSNSVNGGESLNQNFSISQGIQSIERGTMILDEIKRNEKSLTLTELSQKVHMSKNGLKKYLVSFVRVGILTFDEEKKTYSFGSKLIEFGLNALNRFSIFSIADPYLMQIKNEINQSSALAVWTEKGPMIAKYQGGGRSVNVEIETGYYPSLLGSSVGRCFAAFLPTQFTKDIIDSEVMDYDLDRSLIMEDLNRIKETGFSSRDTYFGDLPGNHSISCPIFDYSGTMKAAICVLGFTNDLNIDAQSNEVNTLKEITRKMSERLAYQS